MFGLSAHNFVFLGFDPLRKQSASIRVHPRFQLIFLDSVVFSLCPLCSLWFIPSSGKLGFTANSGAGFSVSGSSSIDAGFLAPALLSSGSLDFEFVLCFLCCLLFHLSWISANGGGGSSPSMAADLMSGQRSATDRWRVTGD